MGNSLGNLMQQSSDILNDPWKRVFAISSSFRRARSIRETKRIARIGKWNSILTIDEIHDFDHIESEASPYQFCLLAKTKLENYRWGYFRRKI